MKFSINGAKNYINESLRFEMSAEEKPKWDMKVESPDLIIHIK